MLDIYKNESGKYLWHNTHFNIKYQNQSEYLTVAWFINNQIKIQKAHVL